MRWWPWLLFPTLASVACERDFHRPSWQPGAGAGVSGEGGGGNAGTESAGSSAQSSGTGGLPRGGSGGAGAAGKAPSEDGGSAGVSGQEAGNGGTGAESNRPPTAVFDFYHLDREDADSEDGAGGESGAPTREPGTYTIRGGVGSLSSNDLDPDGDTLRVEAGTVVTERGGTAKLTAGGGFTYTPPSKRFWGNDYFEYSVSDGKASSKGRARITLTVSVVRLQDLDAEKSNGWLIVGSDERESVGYFAGRAGDVNGDGLDDLIVAAGWGAGSGSDPEAAAYVVFGRTETTPVLLDQFETGTSAGFMIQGFRPGYIEPGVVLEGWPVNGIGDVNGDGFDDIAIRSLPYSGAPAPVVYVVFGGRGTETVVLNTITDAGTSSWGIRINPLDPSERFGTSIAGAGDLNGDGYDEFVIGAPGAVLDENPEVGAAYVIRGGPDFGTREIKLRDVIQSAGYEPGFFVRGSRTNSRTGFSVAGAGDVNGDGLADLIVGAPDEPLPWLTSNNAGSAYVVYGSPEFATVDLGWLETESAVGFMVRGAENPGALGGSVSGAGYFNVGDALEDVVMGIPSWTEWTLNHSGGAYLTFGSTEHASDKLIPDALSARGYLVRGFFGSTNQGRSVAAGDFDADGWSDISMAGNESARETYVAFGGELPDERDARIVSVESTCEGGGSAGTRTLCFDYNDYGMHGPTTSGDFNGDGIDDVFVGAPGTFWPRGGGHIVFGWDARGRMREHHVSFSGGAAPDTIDYAGGEILRLSGGRGVDTVKLTGQDFTWDLRTIEPTRLESIEVIDLSDEHDFVLILDDDHIRSLPSSRIGPPQGLKKVLTVLGTAEDTLRVDLADYVELTGSEERRLFQRRGLYYGLEIDARLTVTGVKAR